MVIVPSFRRALLFASLAAFCSPAWAQQPGCLTDGLHAHLKQVHPQGVPGRNAFSAAKTEDYPHTLVIPVVVHVLHENGAERNITEAQILSQIEVLNEDYNRRGNGANTHPDGENPEISFCLATVDPEGNAHPGYEYIAYDGAANWDPYEGDTTMKRATGWDPNRYLNIWTVRSISSGTIKGYAYFPDEVAGTSYDGVVVAYQHFGRTGTALLTTNGRTCTHEVGHYLGLYHPWGLNSSNCGLDPDFCDDTPKVSDAAYALFPSCSSALTCDNSPRQVENYMDYSNDRCMDMFTKCQADRMRSAILNYRGKLVSADNLVATQCQTAADTASSRLLEFLVYPVPTSSNVFVVPASEGTTSPISYRVFSPRGELVQSGTVAMMATAPVVIDMSQMLEGVYLLEVTVGAKVLDTRRIMVLR